MINENLLRIYESLSQLMLCSTDEAVNNALFLLEHIADENQNSVVVSRGDSKEIFNSSDFFQNIAQVLGMSDKYQKVRPGLANLKYEKEAIQRCFR